MSVFNTKAEAARRRSRLYALIALALPQAELVKLMTSPKPPSESDLIAYVKRTAAESLRCAHCGGSLLDIETGKPFTPPRAHAREEIK